MSDGAGRQVFRTSSFTRFCSWIWLGLSFLLIFDVVRRGTIESSGWVAIAVLLFVSSVVWAIWLRPQVTVDDERVVLCNPFRDVVVPWQAVTGIGATDMLRIQVGESVHRGWAIQAPERARRRAAKASKAVRGERGHALSEDLRAELSNRTHAEFVAMQLRERWAAHRPDRPSGPESVDVSWSPIALAAVLGTLVFLVAAIVAA
jgi:hypothetical protein